MLQILARKWWALALRGLVALAFGLLTLFKPGITLAYLVLLFGVYVLVDGLLEIFASLRSLSTSWALLLEGVISVIAGIMTIMWPGITAIFLLYLIAFWAIFSGLFEVIAGIRLRKLIANEWALILMGIASVVFGAFILFAPVAGALAIVWWIGLYALVFGTMLLVFAFKLRAYGERHSGPTPLPRPA